jgi:hypothetical protein
MPTRFETLICAMDRTGHRGLRGVAAGVFILGLIFSTVAVRAQTVAANQKEQTMTQTKTAAEKTPAANRRREGEFICRGVPKPAEGQLFFSKARGWQFSGRAHADGSDPCRPRRQLYFPGRGARRP